jgi:chemotaxis protein MotB
MAKKCHCEEGLAEWIMSYADMITILMAFFVVMYSMAGDKKENPKVDAVMDSLRSWLGPAREHWPTSRARSGRRLITAFDVPTPPDRHRGATENTKATVPQPNATFPDGVTIYVPAATSDLEQAVRDDLSKVLETVAGKMNLIEIRGQAKRHVYRKLGAGQSASDMVYDKCRLVMDFLLSRGVNPERIQIRIVRAEGTSDETGLAASNRDIQVDVFMLNQLLSPQTAVPSTESGIFQRP